MARLTVDRDQVISVVVWLGLRSHATLVAALGAGGKMPDRRQRNEVTVFSATGKANQIALFGDVHRDERRGR